jgi:hypothetical protein
MLRKCGRWTVVSIACEWRPSHAPRMLTEEPLTASALTRKQRGPR